MIEIARIVEHQANLSSYRATQNEARAEQLEQLIELTKPINPSRQWHPLIATPFRYDPPHPHTRFRPSYGKNVFYGSTTEETALYEHAFHFMRQRMHLDITTTTGTRTLFFVKAHDESAIHINDVAVMNKNDYSASHQFILANPHATFLIYPSCRDPQKQKNAAILDINHLEKTPTWETSISFFYDNKNTRLTWINQQLHITWKEVC